MRPTGSQPAVPSRRLVLLRWGAASVVVVALAWLSYTRDGWVPLLSAADFGIHEFGHLLFMWAPPLIVYLSGSVVQVSAPACLAGYFWWRRERLAVVAMLAWLGVSLNSVAVYVGDAVRRVLPLWGDDGSGDNHDWNNILFRLGWLDRTDSLATLVQAASAASFLAALGMAGWFARQDLRAAAPPHDSGLPIVRRT